MAAASRNPPFSATRYAHQLSVGWRWVCVCARVLCRNSMRTKARRTCSAGVTTSVSVSSFAVLFARRESRKRAKVSIASRRPRARQQRCRPSAKDGGSRPCESVTYSSYVQPRREPGEDRPRWEPCRDASSYGRGERRQRWLRVVLPARRTRSCQVSKCRVQNSLLFLRVLLRSNLCQACQALFFWRYRLIRDILFDTDAKLIDAEVASRNDSIFVRQFRYAINNNELHDIRQAWIDTHSVNFVSTSYRKHFASCISRLKYVVHIELSCVYIVFRISVYIFS